MIASLHGRLLSKDAQGAVIDCGGVGYGLAMSLSSLSRLGAEGGDVQVLVHTHVTQDNLRLYGFVDAAERGAFGILIGITGVGPRLALAILSALSPGELSEVVTRADKATLKRIPGIGGKTAERLLVELKHRLPKGGAHPVTANKTDVATDLAAALASLGFKPSAADEAARETLEAHPEESDLAGLVRLALRSTTRI